MGFAVSATGAVVVDGSFLDSGVPAVGCAVAASASGLGTVVVSAAAGACGAVDVSSVASSFLSLLLSSSAGPLS